MDEETPKVETLGYADWKPTEGVVFNVHAATSAWI
jgi:hypothetical protein